jgi:hypothetical protein
MISKGLTREGATNMEQEFQTNGLILMLWFLFLVGGLGFSAIIIWLIRSCRRDSWLA